MNDKAKKKENKIPNYVTKPISPEEEPNYKELYFNLLNDFENVRSYIKTLMDESVRDLHKSFKINKVDLDKYP